MKKSIIQQSRDYAEKAHESVNQKYGIDNPYVFHLDMAFYTGVKFSYILSERDIENVLSAVYLHDVIEDCRVSYNDLVKASNTKIADLVYAVTNEKGKTRDERANDSYYNGIKNTENAIFVKLCDRIANVEYSSGSIAGIRNSMFECYKKENVHFLQKLGLYHSSQPCLTQTKYMYMAEYLLNLFN